MTVRLVGLVSSENEYIDSANYTLELTPERVKEIKDLAKKVSELEAYELTFFDHAIEVFDAKLYDQDDVEDEYKTEGSLFNNTESERLEGVCKD